jgi:hypothetical protein
MTTIALPREGRRGRSPQQQRPSYALGDGDSGLPVVGGLLWLSAVIRVLLGLSNHEVFATEASLALATIVVLPWLAFEHLRAKRRNAR